MTRERFRCKHRARSNAVSLAGKDDPQSTRVQVYGRYGPVDNALQACRPTGLPVRRRWQHRRVFLHQKLSCLVYRRGVTILLRQVTRRAGRVASFVRRSPGKTSGERTVVPVRHWLATRRRHHRVVPVSGTLEGKRVLVFLLLPAGCRSPGWRMRW